MPSSAQEGESELCAAHIVVCKVQRHGKGATRPLGACGTRASTDRWEQVCANGALVRLAVRAAPHLLCPGLRRPTSAGSRCRPPAPHKRFTPRHMSDPRANCCSRGKFRRLLPLASPRSRTGGPCATPCAPLPGALEPPCVLEALTSSTPHLQKHGLSRSCALQHSPACRSPPLACCSWPGGLHAERHQRRRPATKDSMLV